MPQETPVNKSVYETEFEEFLSVNSRANQSRAFAAIFGVLTESQQGRIVEALGGKAPLPPQEAPATEGLRRKIDAENRLSLLIDTIMLGAARCGLFDMVVGGPYTGTQALAAVRDLVDELVKLQEADRARFPASPITFVESDGTERRIRWEDGDPDVGIRSGYIADDEKWEDDVDAVKVVKEWEQLQRDTSARGLQVLVVSNAMTFALVRPGTPGEVLVETPVFRDVRSWFDAWVERQPQA